jgi:hypothetical protein
VRLEGSDQLKNPNGLVGNRTRDLPACSIVPQPTTLPHAPIKNRRNVICHYTSMELEFYEFRIGARGSVVG